MPNLFGEHSALWITFVEPFFGSGAVLLHHPYSPSRIETVNDINAWLTNFWRAVQRDPEAVAVYADYPVSELDLHVRGDWLFYRREALEFVERLRTDPDYYDAQSAGWWLWGICQWIGSGWERKESCRVIRQLPHLRNAGMGVNRKRPHLGDSGKGVNRKRLVLGTSGRQLDRGEAIREYMQQLSDRLREVRICCGDWRRVLGPSPTFRIGLTGVFLDPPYAPEGRDDVYGAHDDAEIFSQVQQWAIENGNNRLIRIALCGYNFKMPEGWTPLRWRPGGGYSSLGNGNGKANRNKEMVWFSPHCALVQPELMSA